MYNRIDPYFLINGFYFRGVFRIFQGQIPFLGLGGRNMFTRVQIVLDGHQTVFAAPLPKNLLPFGQNKKGGGGSKYINIAIERLVLASAPYTTPPHESFFHQRHKMRGPYAFPNLIIQ